MKTIVSYVTLLGIVLSISAVSFAQSGVPLDPTPDDIQAAKERNAAFSDLEKDLFGYYQFHNEKHNIIVQGGITEHFAVSMQIDEKNGDIMLVIAGTGKERVECNLTYNLALFEKNLYALQKNKQSDAQERNRIKIVSTQFPPPTTILQRRGTIYLYANDYYLTQSKIWNAYIWDELVKVAAGNPDQKYQIEYPLVLKVKDNFYSLKAIADIDSKSIKLLNANRNKIEAQESKEKNVARVSPMARISIQTNAKGERQVSITPGK